MHKDKRYYLYIYFDTRAGGVFKYGNLSFNFEPFYVGIGVKDRYLDHLIEASISDKNSLKLNLIRKIIKSTKNNPQIDIYKKNLTRKNAIKLEKNLIKIIGRRHLRQGPLANISPGGIGGDVVADHPNRKEILKKLSFNSSGKNNNMYGVHRFGSKNPFFGKKHSKAAKLKMSKFHRYKKVSQITIEKMKKSLLGRKFSKEHKRKLSLAHIGLNTLKGKYKFYLYNLISMKYVVTGNLSEFCRKHNMNASNLYDTFSGRCKHHKNWVLKKKEKLKKG